jgi:hypothetical protein
MSMFGHQITGRKVDPAARAAPDFVRREVADPQGNSDANSVLRRALLSSTREIDQLITELQIMKERIQLESERVQREIMGYASMSQAAMDSSKIIAERLTNFRKTPDVPTVSE